MRRRYTFATRQDAERAHSAAQQRETHVSIALAEVLASNVAWLEQGNYRLGLLRLDGPSGGFAIVVWKHPGQRDTVHVWQLDELYAAHGPRWAALNTDPDGRDLAALVMRGMDLRSRLLQ